LAPEKYPDSINLSFPLNSSFAFTPVDSAIDHLQSLVAANADDCLKLCLLYRLWCSNASGFMAYFWVYQKPNEVLTWKYRAAT